MPDTTPNTPPPSPFKAYDVRGQIGLNVDADFAHRLGRAAAHVTGARRAVLGHDARATSPAYAEALARGLAEAGSAVQTLGLCGTEEVYFGTAHLDADLGIMVTASHNPIGDNGFKLVGRGAATLEDVVFRQVEAATLAGEGAGSSGGSVAPVDLRDAYVSHLLSFIDAASLPPLSLVVNAGNGAAGPTFDALDAALRSAGAGLSITRIHHDPDPAFPHGIPNPLLPENHAATAEPVLAAGADLGVAWDGDFDRCFFFDHTGAFIPGEYIVGLLAQATLDRVPGARIVHDPRVQWNTQALVAEMGGEAVASRTGHALIKAKMRAVDAAYGGEMSAHHYFRDFLYCDSGMVPLLLILSWMGKTGQSLEDLVSEMRDSFPSSGEINFRVEDPGALLAEIERDYASGASIDRLDGLSLAYADWRFNLRRSNTEPLVRLNVETRGDRALLDAKVAALSARIAGAA
ncbi:MAG: phosphomannomutase [Pseudomonadota bacterium]